MSLQQPPEKRPGVPYCRFDGVANESAIRELQHDLPVELARSVVSDLAPDEGIVFSFPVDMNLLGQYSQEWLVLTTRRCMAWEETATGYEPRPGFSLSDLRDVRVRRLTGNQILLVDDGAGWREFVRSSNLTAWKLKPTLQLLKAAAEDGAELLKTPHKVDLKLPERQVCPSCGRTIRPRLGVCVACMDKRKILWRLVGLLMPYLRVAGAAFGLLVAGGLLAMLPPLVSRAIFDLVFVPAVDGNVPEWSFWYSFADPASVTLLLLLSAVTLVLIIVPSLIGAVRDYVFAWLGNRVVVDLSNRVFSHMMRLSLSFYHREETGRAMARITRDVGRIRRFISQRLVMFLYDILLVLLIVVVLFALNWRLAAIVLLPIPVLIGASEFARRKLHRVYHTLWHRYAAINRFLSDTIPGIRVVKAFAQSKREVGRFEGIMGRIFSHEMRATRVRVALHPVINVSTQMGRLLVLVAGGIMLIRGTPGITVGTISAFTAYMMMFYRPMQDLARVLPEFEHAATSADRVFEVLDSEPELDTEDREIVMPTIEGKVEFEHVSFSYEPDEEVLHDVSFRVEPGEMIGLVGHSGAGKTTIINLVCHFYKVDQGRVLIDDIDVRDVKVESLRNQVGIVSQEPFLFSGTIGENIAYSKPGASQREVVAAAMAANAHEFIMDFPEAYDTMVGERGARVSGGERQRIAIARAILKNPRILILDEATSSVDTETEEKIQQALHRLIAGRTTFAIAHRISTLKYANRLLVLEDGNLVEIGTHDELMQQGGVYARLCEKQSELSKLTAWTE